MRRNISSFTWILLLAACAGCQQQTEKDVLFIDNGISERQPQMIITAFMEGGKESKTTLGNPGNGNYRPYWEENDEIAIYDLVNYSVGRFALQSGAGTDEATFIGVGSGTDLVGLYPYSSRTDDGLWDQVLTLELPSVQQYAQGSFGNGAYPMLAIGQSSGLVFKNLCAILQLSVTGTHSVEAIRFIAHDPGMSVSGKGTVRIDYETEPELVMSEEGSTEVTLQCGGVGLDPDVPTDFFLVIPPGTYKGGFELEIISESGKMIRKTDNDVIFKRSQYRTIPTFAFTPEIEVITEPDPVDLGLPSGLKWASFNLGANRPEGYGDYYAWGETEPKDDYYWSTYKWCMGEYYTLTKYCNNSSSGYNEYTDTKNVLDPEDDAAKVNLGGSWRMPTDDEWTELRENCTWTWTTQKGVEGRLVTASNGNSIFLPAAGNRLNTGFYDANLHGNYWSSSLDTNYPFCAWSVDFWDSDVYRSSSFGRCFGFSIRPVYDDGMETKIETKTPTNIGPCSAEIPYTISTDEVINNFGIVYSTNKTEPVVGNYGDGNALSYYSSEAGSSMIIPELKPNTTYYARVFITVGEEHGPKLYGNTIRFTTKDLSYSTEYVDIGLSVKWATCNLGSSSPSDVGGYYSWGETVPTSLRTQYKWSGPDGYTKYNADDGKVTLDASDDAASVNLGEKWRMPTNEEITELRNKCTWAQATRNGVLGSTVTGPNGKSIFIPVSEGFSAYFNAEILSSSLSTYTNDAYKYVYALSYNYGENAVYFLRTFRYWGTPVRPVYDDSGTNPEIGIPEPVDLGLSVKWASFNLGANKPEGFGYHLAWGEIQEKEYYDWNTYKWCAGSNTTLTKYNNNPSYGLDGYTDDKMELEPEDDAARYYLGGEWRMPSQKEWIELCSNTEWTWSTVNGVNGYEVRSTITGNTLFFPAAGYGPYSSSPGAEGAAACYWSTTVVSFEPYSAYSIYFDTNRKPVPSVDYDARCNRYSIRPVFGKP